MFLLILAFKNILRHKRRTILNITALAINVAGIVFFTAFYRGRIVDNYDRTINYLTSHIQIHNPLYETEKRRLPLDLTIKDSKKIKNDLKNHEWIRGVSERVEFAIIVNNGLDQMPCLGIGIQPEEERNIGILPEVITGGDYLVPGEEGILIGSKMAELLNLKVGDIVFLYVTTSLNQPNLFETEVRGIFHYGFPMLDKYVIHCSYDFIREYLNMPEGATKMMIMLKDRRLIPEMMNYLSEYNLKEYSGELQINRWEYFAQPLIEDVKGDTFFMGIFFFILVLVGLFGIINSMSTSVFERTQEIGTIRAVGTRRDQTVRLFLFETLAISLIGVMIGWIIGFAISLYLARAGIPLGQAFSETEMMAVPMGEKLYAVLGIWEYLGTLLLGLCAGLIGGISPALRASRLKIVDALRK